MMRCTANINKGEDIVYEESGGPFPCKQHEGTGRERVFTVTQINTKRGDILESSIS
jgi:hypothetical protein